MEQVTITFILDDKEIKIQGSKDEQINEILKKYTKESKNQNKIIEFYHNGNRIGEEVQNLKIKDVNNNDNEITIIVKEKKLNNFLNSSIAPAPVPINEIKHSKDIICPICKKCCIISFKDYKLNLHKCGIRSHIINNILLNEYEKTQLIDDKKFCNNCHNETIDYNNNKFYRCLTCIMNLCSKCKSLHNEDHIVVDQGSVNYKCKHHGTIFSSYCELCEENLCYICEDFHKDHNIINFKTLIPKYNVRQKLNEFRLKIDKFNEDIKSIIDKLNFVSNGLEVIYKINNDIINNYEKKNKNYQIYKNIFSINEYNKEIMKDIEQIITANNNIQKFEYIEKMYHHMTVKNEIKSKDVMRINSNVKSISSKKRKLKLTNTTRKTDKYEKKDDDIIIEYKIPKNNTKIMIFGSEFIKNNGDICEIYINDKYRDISQTIDLKTCKIENDILEIKLRVLDTLTNLSYMFSGCLTLYSLQNLSKLKTNNVTKMNHLFNMCESLTSISDISKWNISKVTDISYMFNGCKSLSSLPDISNWNTINVEEMRNIFSGCKALKSMPDISNWNVSKISNLSYVFNDCYSLKSLSDISKWDIKNVKDINHMFSNCFSLESLPDLSKWNITNINNIIYLFYGCKSLILLPDISKWNISNATNLISVFGNCESIEELPDISKWDTKNIIDMSKLFYNCYNLLSLPDLSKWNTDNVTNMSFMFYYCQSLTNIPDISKWNTSNVTDLNNMFCGCDSLKEYPNISSWDVAKVKDMSYMFANCYSLKNKLDISKWNVSQDTKKEQMFYYISEDTPSNERINKEACLII